ncbi:MAG: penicillin acylase, partial [Alphaproteobacteria bacterium]|nr:penicillin acylase [Alphaproteobacteria bacterium]
LMAEALDEAAATTAEAWGEAHKPRFAHPLSGLFPAAAAVLDPPSLPIGGDGDTVWANGLVAPLGPRATYGALARYAFDVGDWEKSRWSVFLGASGHPASPFYANQHAAWASCSMTPMRYEWAGIAAGAVATQRLLA